MAQTRNKRVTSLSLSDKALAILDQLSSMYEVNRTLTVERALRETLKRETHNQEWPIRTTEDKEKYSVHGNT